MKEQVLHYRIERRLGAGGMGEVWLARDTRLDRPVALKFLAAGRDADASARERLLREARAASRLSHPGILTVYAVESDDDLDFLVMEYVDGTSLRDLIPEGGLPLKRALDLGIQVAEGLEAAHGSGVVHRDVKPDNVMVDRRDRARVMDFGLSLVTNATRMTKEGNATGTLAYMSPEQARARDLDRRTDIFSFGILLQEVMTGRLPFRSDPGSPASALFAILNEPPDPVSMFRADCPESLQRILDRALEKDRDLRYPDVATLLADLRAVRAGLDSGESVVLPSQGDPAAVAGSATGSGTTRASSVGGPPTPVPAPAVTTPPPVDAAPRRFGAGTTVLLVFAVTTLALFLSRLGADDGPKSPEGPEPSDLGTHVRPDPTASGGGSRPVDAPTPPSPSELRVARQRLLSIPGEGASEATLSPDGAQVAFVMKDEKGIAQIWMRSLDEGDPLQVTRETAACSVPSWAPKGGLIAYCRDEGYLGTPLLRLCSLWVVSPPTGSPRKVKENGHNPSWTADGKRILFEDYRGIHTIDTEGGDERTIEGLPEGKFPMPVRRAKYSPDGSRIAFFHNDLGPAGDYWIVGADGSDLRRLTNKTDLGGGFVWDPGGKALIVSAGWGGSTTLWRVPVDGGRPTPVTSGTGEDSQPAISPDGRTIVFTNARHEYALRVLDLKTGKSRTIRESRASMGVPEFSPDGERIVFFGGEEAGSHLLTLDRDGRNLRAVTRGPDELHLFPEWDAEGKGLYYYRKDPEGKFTWEWIAADGGSSRVLRAGWTVHFQVFARVSPDGKQVVYLENRGLQTLPATVLESMDGESREELPVVLLYPRWSPDGTRLLGFGLNGGVTVVDMETRKGTVVARGFGCNWSRDGKDVYFLATDTTPDAPGKHALFRVPATGGDAVRVANLGTMSPLSAIIDTGSHDDLVWVDDREGRPELWVLELEGGGK